MNQSTVRLIGWGMPLLCIVCAAGLSVNQAMALQTAQAERSRAAMAVTKSLADQQEAARHQASVKFAAADQGPGEESAFLYDLRANALSSGVTIVNWTSTTNTYTNPNDPNTDLIKDITKIGSILTLRGNYAALRKFIENLTQANRLYTLTNIAWSKEKGKAILLTCTLGRYVAPAQSTPVAPTPTTPTPSASPAPSGKTA